MKNKKKVEKEEEQDRKKENGYSNLFVYKGTTYSWDSASN